MSTQIAYKIARVKDTSFSVNETLYDANYPADKIQIRINCEIRFNQEADFIMIDINPSYLYKKEGDGAELILGSINVHNAFKVKDVKDFVENDTIYIPTNFLITLVSLSISHTRALFSKNLDGTALNGIIMPIIDPVDFCKNTFGYMFDYEEAKNRKKQSKGK